MSDSQYQNSYQGSNRGKRNRNQNIRVEERVEEMEVIPESVGVRPIEDGSALRRAIYALRDKR